MKTTTMVDGIRGLQIALDRLTEDIHDELEKELDAEAKATATDEKSRINRVSGDLQRAITVEADGDLRRLIGPHNPDVYYAVFVEWGRGPNADAFPFATPAAEGARRRWRKSSAEAVKRATRKAS